MARFEGTHTQRVEVAAPIEVVRAHFADLRQTVAATTRVRSSTIEGEVVRFVLEPIDAGIVKFQSEFRCRYTWRDGVLTWATIDGNTDQAGEARFEALTPDRTAVSFRERVAVDLPVPALAARMLEPVVSQVLTREVKAFLDRMVGSIRT